MRLTIQRRDLSRLILAVKGASSEKSAVPALANVLLAAEDGMLRTSATDLYRAASLAAPCGISAPGRVCLPAADLAVRIVELGRKLPDGLVDIEVDGNAHATLRAVGTPRRFTLHGLPGGEFPALPVRPDAVALTVPAATLSAMFARVACSVSTDTTRPNVNAALVEWTHDTVRMVSTDGHRLSLDVASCATGGVEGALLIPLAALIEVRRLVDAAEDGSTVSVFVSDPWIHLSIIGSELAPAESLAFAFKIAALPQAFPPYRQLLAQPAAAVCRVNRETFGAAVGAVATAAEAKIGSVRLTFAPGAVRIAAESAESGSGFDEVRAEYTGAEVTSGFNAAYLADALRACDTDDVDLGVGVCAEDPLVVRPVGAGGYVCVVMPKRI